MEKINDYMTREEAISWAEANPNMLKFNIKMTGEQVNHFFAVYNAITGEGKSITGCGKCIWNMRQRLQVELKKIELMKSYPVYLTAKGNYTFKPNGTPVAYIRAATETIAKEQLDLLKKEKSNVQ
jgi:hypothetical protein